MFHEMVIFSVNPGRLVTGEWQCTKVNFPTLAGWNSPATLLKRQQQRVNTETSSVFSKMIGSYKKLSGKAIGSIPGQINPVKQPSQASPTSCLRDDLMMNIMFSF